MKLAFILVELFIAIAFAATTFTKHQNVAAVLEWIVAFIFTFYVLTFFIDLFPALRMKQGDLYGDNNSSSNYDGTTNFSSQEMGYSNGQALNGGQAGARDSGYYGDGAVPQPKPTAGQNF
ncbi:MAG: hypothetical protein M1812_000446 [Candelaria pacifica]|nr:MAG: hypothetical protein M1812_000446 [Candelaria pacifica]